MTNGGQQIPNLPRRGFDSLTRCQMKTIYKNILEAARLDYNWMAHPITIISIPIYYIAKIFNIHNKTYEKE